MTPDDATLAQLEQAATAPNPAPVTPNPNNPALRTPWTGNDYGPNLHASGALKLATSGIAPLIAAARGYTTLTTPSSVTTFRATRRIPKHGGADTTRTAILERINDGGDVLAMPWFRIDHVLTHTPTDPRLGMDTAQYRPNKPSYGETLTTDGTLKRKPQKYFNEHRDNSVLDLHPATPATWLTTADATSRVLFIEGLLKADSALTHLLLAHGATLDDLTHLDGTIDDHRARLHTLMEHVPPAARCAIIAMVGVGNWAASPERAEIPLKHRKAYIAFDGDIATNRNVWIQAKKLADWLDTRSADPTFLRLDNPTIRDHITTTPPLLDRIGLDPDGRPNRLGLDDFLANVGTWQQALDTASDALPEQPPASNLTGLRVGDFLIYGEHGNYTGEYTKNNLTGINEVRERLTIGGRLLSIESSRVPTPEEADSNITNHDNDADTSHTQAEVELSWTDDDNIHHTAVVRGPSAFIADDPRRWVKDPNVRIPPDVLSHPDFPPAKYSWEFLSALKKHRSDETHSRTGWSVMGWVPTDTGTPAFIIGNQVLAQRRSDETHLFAGLTEDHLPGATSFGVIDTYQQLRGDHDTLTPTALEQWKAQVRADLRETVRRFFIDSVFATPAIPAIILGAMIRPTIPPKPQLTVFFWGPPAGGKSYCASATLGGWRSRPGAWRSNKLPGAAGDTPAAAELAVSMTPIWVADDLAPSPDRGKTERQEDEIGNLIRSIFNNQPKRRTEQGREMRSSNTPRALLIATAENEPRTDSVRDRSIMVEIGAGTFNPNMRNEVASFKEFFEEDPTLPRLIGAMIRYWMHADQFDGTSWPDRVHHGHQLRRYAATTTETYISDTLGVNSNRLTRHTGLAAEIAMAYQVLVEFAEWVGIDTNDPILDWLDPSPHVTGSAVHAMYELVATTLQRQAETTPATNLLRVLNALLGSGGAHLANPDHPGMPPHPTDDAINERLGWRFDTSRGEGGVWVPKGPQIGYLIESSTEPGVLLAFLHHTTAFQTARRAFPDQILPGQGERASWAETWSLGIAYGKRQGRALTVQLRPKAPGAAADDGASRERERGIPIPLTTLLDPETWAHHHTTRRHPATE